MTPVPPSFEISQRDYEVRSMLKYGALLASAAQAGRIKTSDLERMDDEQWMLLAQAARMSTVPGKHTRLTAIMMLRVARTRKRRALKLVP